METHYRGAGIALDTKIPTPSGWATMGSLKTGDEVFGSDGRTYPVTHKLTRRTETCVLHFDDGTRIACGSGHNWRSLTRAKADQEVVLSTLGVAEHLARPKFSPSNHGLRILNARPLQLPSAELPIDPYLLGTWLGDGDSVRGFITKGDTDLFDILCSDGHELGKRSIDRRSGVASHTVLGLGAKLREADLLRNKHLPDAYLRAGEDQRLAAVRGMMDTDGSWNIARNTAVFSNTNKTLIVAMEELLLSLGQRPRISEFIARGFGKEITSYHVEFTPLDIVPFRLPRKKQKCIAGVQMKTNDVRSRRRSIRRVEAAPEMPVVSIGVDSPDGTHLCTERMVPILAGAAA